MVNRWVVHVEKGEDAKLSIVFGGQLHLRANVIWWFSGIALVVSILMKFFL